MSLVRSIMPPPDQVPAIMANGCTLAGAAGGTSSASGGSTRPSGIRSNWIWAAAGTKADASTKTAAPQISFNVMALSPLTERFACIGGFGQPLGSIPSGLILVWSILLRSILRWNEHIADAADGPDRIRMRRIGLDLAAQPGDAEVDGAVEGLHSGVG